MLPSPLCGIFLDLVIFWRKFFKWNILLINKIFLLKIKYRVLTLVILISSVLLVSQLRENYVESKFIYLSMRGIKFFLLAILPFHLLEILPSVFFHFSFLRNMFREHTENSWWENRNNCARVDNFSTMTIWKPVIARFLDKIELLCRFIRTRLKSKVFSLERL